MSVFYCNAHALIELVEQKFDFSNEPELCYYLLQFTSRKGFYQMSKLLFYLMQAKLKFTKINNLVILYTHHLYYFILKGLFFIILIQLTLFILNFLFFMEIYQFYNCLKT